MHYYSMKHTSSSKLAAERKALLAELSSLSEVVQGSWLERYTTCSRKDCRCHQGERHGPRYYLVINEGGRQRPKYIPNVQVEKVQNGLKQYRRLKEIVARLTQINLAEAKGKERNP
jgi:hypothetical protein